MSIRQNQCSSWIDEYKASIKSRDTEEKLDLVLYRPLGFIIAKFAHFLKMTPSQLSILGALCGVLAAIIFATHYGSENSFFYLIAGSILFILSGIFDSSDGQLARIANMRTKMGLVLDGVCDAISTIAIYVGISVLLIQNEGWLWSIVVVLAMMSHSYQCAILDFYHREYLFFGIGKVDGEYWNPTYEEMGQIIEKSSTPYERIANHLRRRWVAQQELLSGRTPYQRILMKDFLLKNHNSKLANDFMFEYRKLNLSMLPLWRLIGTNAHTVLIIIFLFFGDIRFYFLTDIVILNLLIVFIAFIQKRRDKKLFDKFAINKTGTK